MSLTSTVENTRGDIDKKLDLKTRSELGQFMTNWNIAKFMAGLINIETIRGASLVNVLDPGAGVGSLSAALVERIAETLDNTTSIVVDAYEVDETMRIGLSKVGAALEQRYGCHHNIHDTDFIDAAVNILVPILGSIPKVSDRYDLVILNPPYKKISGISQHRLRLREAGIESTNLYTAFWQLSIELAKPGSQITVIVPRSFCNGTYFKPFRQFLKSSCTIKHIHVFDSRKDAFSDNDVLQENVIVYATKNSPGNLSCDSVELSRSADDTFDDMTSISLRNNQIWGSSPESFLFIPTSLESLQVIEKINSLPCTLLDLGLKVSTGPVVQFRLRSSLSLSEGVPMIYCSSMSKGYARQNFDTKKLFPFITVSEKSLKWLVDDTQYLIIRRFSSKEEKRRIVCAIYQPNKNTQFPSLLGIDNKLNYIYSINGEFEIEIIYGLYVYLSCSYIDKYYRLVSGHTQVNSGDLKTFKYPSADQLQRIGKSFMDSFSPLQSSIDSAAKAFLDEQFAKESYLHQLPQAS